MPSPYLLTFDPIRDADGWVIEDPEKYAIRIGKLLPYWPKEVLVEWLHRHNTGCDRYEHLGFENFRFCRAKWPVEKIPDRSAYWDPKHCDNFQDIERRARKGYPEDWLARYMLRNGTWNTPPVLLENLDGSIDFDAKEKIKAPYHLLEGHRRLAFLNGLKNIGKAGSEHDVWIVTLANET